MELPARRFASADRRWWLARTAAVAGGAVLSAVGWRQATAGLSLSGYTVTLAQLLALLSERFPQRYRLAGIAELELRAPALALRPEVNRLRARLTLVLSGASVATPREGVLEVEFGMRYAAQDRTLRAHDIALQAVEIEGLDPAASALLQFWAPRMARRALREVVLHRLEEKDLALLDGLGLQPGPITVTPQGLSIAFVPRALNTQQR